MLLPAQVDMLKAVQADLQRSQQSLKGTKLAGGSNTTPDAHVMAVHGSSGRGRRLSHIIAASVLESGAEMAGHVVSAVGGSGVGVAAARLGTTVAGALGNALRQAGMRRVDDLVDLAAAHPGLARALMMKAPATADAEAWAHFRRQLGLAAASAGVAAQRKPPRGSDGGSALAVLLGDLRRVSAGYFGH